MPLNLVNPLSLTCILDCLFVPGAFPIAVSAWFCAVSGRVVWVDEEPGLELRKEQMRGDDPSCPFAGIAHHLWSWPSQCMHLRQAPIGVLFLQEGSTHGEMFFVVVHGNLRATSGSELSKN